MNPLPSFRVTSVSVPCLLPLARLTSTGGILLINVFIPILCPEAIPWFMLPIHICETYDICMLAVT